MKNPGIYILTSPSGKQYVGRDSNLPYRVKRHFSEKSSNCAAIHEAIKKYGADAFHVEIIRYPGISHEALNAIEKWKIKQLQTLSAHGYNLTDGGDSGKPSKETRQKMSKITSQHIANGTHNFVGDSHPNRKRVANGTHHFFGGDIQRKRVADGTHHFLDGKIQRETQRRRVADGTHNLLGKNNPSHKRVADRTHNLLGKNQNVLVKLSVSKYKVVYQHTVLIPRAYWTALNSLHLHRKLTRDGFFDKDIPDTSNAEQEYLF